MRTMIALVAAALVMFMGWQPADAENRLLPLKDASTNRFRLTDASPDAFGKLADRPTMLTTESVFRLAQAPSSPSTTTAPEGSGEPSMAELAQKSNNPLSDVWLLLSQNDTTLFEGDLVDDTKVFNSFKFQPVMPVPLFEQKWNLIFRPVFQIQSVPLDKDVGRLAGVNQDQIAVNPDLLSLVQDPFGRTTGLGDTVLLTLLGPNRTDGFVYGAGLTSIFPTATEDVLGQGKWQAGPSLLLLRLGNKQGGFGLDYFNIGILAQHWWSYAGDDDRRSTNQTDIQYFINWRLNATQLIGMTPNLRINWKADDDNKVSFPIGLGTIGLFKMGRLPVRWGIEVQYYVVRPDNIGPEWNFKLFFSPVILNPLKS